MQHFIILFYIFVLTIGLVFSLVLLLLFNKHFSGSSYIYFIPYVLYTVLILFIAFNSYLNLNIKDFYTAHFSNLQKIYLCFESTFLISLIVLVNHLFQINYKKVINTVFFILIIFNIFLNNHKYGDLVYNTAFWFHPRDIVSVLVLLYIIIMSFIHYEKMQNQIIKNLVRTIITIVIVFFPGLMFDITKNSWNSIFFTIGLYCVLSVFLLIYFSKKFIQIELQNKTSNVIPENLDHKEFEKHFKKNSLTDREIEIILLAVKGLTNKKIAEHFHVSFFTVKTHMYNIFKKLEISSRNELILKVLSIK